MGKRYNADNQELLQSLITIYKPLGIDWLNYQITVKNSLTIHHIIKVSDGGILSINNSALLTKRSHRILHMCESRDYFLYAEINDFFREIVSSGMPLSDTFINESKVYKKALTRIIYK